MIYRSNLTCPDLQPAFIHSICRPIPGISHGHSVLSDWADRDGGNGFQIYKDCGFLTHDEAAILYHCCSIVAGGKRDLSFVDIGAHTGWSSLHMCSWGFVWAVEPMLFSPLWEPRIRENLERGHKLLSITHSSKVDLFFGRSDEFMWRQIRYEGSGGCNVDGVMVDGDHAGCNPTLDAQLAHCFLRDNGFILFHDFRGGPVQDAVRWLSVRGYKVRVYYTPNMMAVCFKGEFQPPEHQPDPAIREIYNSSAWQIDKQFPEWIR